MAEQTPTLGEFLRTEREKRGITIEQLASATKINVKILHALEGDHFVELPAKPFIRGFVTSYTRFIGLDAKEVLIRFGGFIDERAMERPSRDAGHSGYAFEKRETEQSRTVLWFIMGGFILFGGAVMVIWKPKFKHQRGTHLEKLREAFPIASPSVGASGSPEGEVPAVVLSPAPSPSVEVSAAPSPLPAPVPAPSPSVTPTHRAKPIPTPTVFISPTPSPSGSPQSQFNPKDPLNNGRNYKAGSVKYKVVFRASVSVPVRYQVDDLPVMRLNLGQDKLLVLKGVSHVRFQVANPEAVQFSYNGGSYQSITAGKNAKAIGNSSVLVFPSQPTESIDDPFKGQPPLSRSPQPMTQNVEPLPSPQP